MPQINRHVLSFFLFAAIGMTLSAQKKCYSSELQDAWFAQHPELKAKYMQAYEKEVARDKAAFKNNYNKNAAQAKPAVATAIYTIPVVFHILHTGGVENISDAQVQDAVAILTRDFNKLNADTSSIVQPFKNLIGDAQIEFQLASKDPLGNCTNGIVRHWDNKTHSWNGNFGDYLYSWPRNNYLNIYVVKTITFNAAGYTYLPGSGIPPAVDAIVVLSSYVGSIGTSNTFLSRVLTHEVGHWLNLPHTWGWASVGTTCGDDGVSDTPITKGFTSCSLGNASICATGITENVQNYMDYAYCEKMFTIGQAAWMQSAMTNTLFNRDYLSDPTNLLQTGITNAGANCLPFVDIQALPGLEVCAGKTLTLKSFTSNANPSSYFWSANNGALITSPNAASTSVVFNTVGTVTISCVVSNANGVDTKSLAVTVKNGVTDITSSNAESFENPSLALPANWSILNPNTPAQKWTLSTLDGMNGTKCMYVPGEEMAAGSLEILESPTYDFKNNPGANFSFKYAYARKNSTHNDLIKLQASKNCGSTWQDIWVPGISGLALGSGGVTADLFRPTFNQWKTYDISNHPYFIQFLNEEQVRFRFYFEEDVNGSGFGNRFYLDDISFSTPVGVNEITRSIGFNVFPNPSKGEFSVEFRLSNTSMVSYKLLSLSGAELLSVPEQEHQSGAQHIDLISGKKLAPGIYFLNLEVNGVVMAKKLVVE